MFDELVVAACLIAATVMIQALFMSAGLRLFNSAEDRNEYILKLWPTVATVVWVLFLLVPVIVDVMLWASVYRLLGALPTFEESTYFSIVTFTTVGYGDIVLSPDFRLLATFEAVNGWIIFGWATALVMIVIQRLYVPSGQRSGKD
jgi:flagellar biosynthesis protein FliQ